MWRAGKTGWDMLGALRDDGGKTLETIVGVPSSSNRRHLSEGHPSTQQLPSSAAANPAKKRKKERSLHLSSTPAAPPGHEMIIYTHNNQAASEEGGPPLPRKPGLLVTSLNAGRGKGKGRGGER